MNDDPEPTSSLRPARPEAQAGDGTERQRPELSRNTIRGWFAEGELGRCPRCRTDSLVTVESGDTYCLDCGYLPDGDEVDSPPARQST